MKGYWLVDSTYIATFPTFEEAVAELDKEPGETVTVVWAGKPLEVAKKDIAVVDEVYYGNPDFP